MYRKIFRLIHSLTYIYNIYIYISVCVCVCVCVSKEGVCYKITFTHFPFYNKLLEKNCHYGDVIMSTIGSQITSLAIVYSIVYSDADQRIHQSSASLAFVRGIHRGPVNCPHKWPVTRKMFPFDDVIMVSFCLHCDVVLLLFPLLSVVYLWKSIWYRVIIETVIKETYSVFGQ